MKLWNSCNRWNEMIWKEDIKLWDSCNRWAKMIWRDRAKKYPVWFEEWTGSDEIASSIMSYINNEDLKKYE